MRQRISKMIAEQRTISWMSTTDALEKLGEGGMKMTAPTLIKLIVRGEIVGKKVGKKYFITVKSIENLLGRD